MQTNADARRKEFYAKAADYRAALANSRSFAEHYELWRKTSIPYDIYSNRPSSEEYKSEVIDIYRALTSVEYATSNEMTSTLQESEEAFESGYPWQSKSLEVIAQEVAKVAQALRALAAAGMEGKKIIEFGAGWGNLAVPLAKGFQDVTVVDIDPGFIGRLQRICDREHVRIATIESDFTEVVHKTDEKFDAAIFQASFHHCLEFQLLLRQMRDRLLTERGKIFFFSEPIFDNYRFPWGLRYDGESLWAIMCNKWLELGFDRSFFANLLLETGFFLTRIPEVPGYVGSGWCAEQTRHPIDFAKWVLPVECDATFHPADTFEGRFCRDRSRLPALPPDKSYRLEVVNYGPKKLAFSIRAGAATGAYKLEPGLARIVDVASPSGPVEISSETFCPAKSIRGNPDTRVLGLNIRKVSVVG